jgi:hypothetical protein
VKQGLLWLPSPATLQPMSVKETVLQAIQRLPDDADYKAIADEIAFLAALRQAEDDIQEGRLVSNEDVRRQLESWTSS